MIIKGYDARLITRARFRLADPARDVDLYGEPLAAPHLVFVTLAECRVWGCVDKTCTRKEKHTHYDPQDAPQHVQLAMAGTWYGFDEWSFSERTGFWGRGVWFANEGRVYKARLTAKDNEPPEDARLRLFARGIIVGKDRILA